jgi:hypothetical protein
MAQSRGWRYVGHPGPMLTIVWWTQPTQGRPPVEPTRFLRIQPPTWGTRTEPNGASHLVHAMMHRMADAPQGRGAVSETRSTLLAANSDEFW